MEAQPQESALQRVLAGLAESRGMNGVEELRERLEKAGHHESARTLLTGPSGGFGLDLDKVLEMDEKEKARVWRAFSATFMAERGEPYCGVPGCERSALEDASLNICAMHRAEFDARAEEEAWDLALSILEPWVEATRHIGSPELTGVMERALEDANTRLSRALDELESARAAL